MHSTSLFKLRLYMRTLRSPALLTLLAVLTLTTMLMPAIAAPGELPKAAQWQGKYPFDRKPSLYQNAALREAATALIGGARYKEILIGWSVVLPIVTDGEALLARGCKPHDCADNSQATLIDGGQVKICITQGGMMTWYVPGQKPVTRKVSAPANTACFELNTVQEARQSLAAMR